jgi:hypothetical protein
MRSLTGGRARFALVVGAVVAVLLVAVAVLVLPRGGGGDPEVTVRALPRPAACTVTVADADRAQQALDELAPGSRLCLAAGEDLADAELTLTASGTADRPVWVTGEATTLRSLDVKADHAVVEGLVLVDGDGLTMTGTGLQARGNEIRRAADDGLRCSECVDTLIEQNVVDGTDGTGIWIEGERIVVRANTVSGSVARESGDADGIRFFGTGLRINGNTVRDIDAAGYEDRPEDDRPHTDCFQTFDDSSPTTYDVVISGNTCTDVGYQCLVATGFERGNAGVPDGERAIVFVGNRCETSGPTATQSVYLENYGNVEVRDNDLLGDSITAGVRAKEDSENVAVIDNRVPPGVLPFDIDDSSRPGFVAAGNVTLS